jgi:hypothetical protein
MVCSLLAAADCVLENVWGGWSRYRSCYKQPRLKPQGDSRGGFPNEAGGIMRPGPSRCGGGKIPNGRVFQKSCRGLGKLPAMPFS